MSPDGRWIAFCRAEPKGKPQLHVVESGGGEPVRLTKYWLSIPGQELDAYNCGAALTR